MAIKNFYEKTTKEFTGTITLDDSVADITSDTVTVYFLTKKEGTKKIEKDADVSLGSGQYKVTLSKTDTAVIPDRYRYEIWWVRSSGKEYLLEWGNVDIYDSWVKS